MRTIYLLIIGLCLIMSGALATSADLRRFEGGWGFVSSDPEDSWWGAGLRGGVAACGAPKQLNIEIRQEQLPDGSSVLRLRWHPDQPASSVVTSISDARLTTESLGETDIFELLSNGNLAITRGATRLLFSRC
jgi:hypothetical protein